MDLELSTKKRKGKEMKKLGILAMASVLTLGTFCTLGVVNSNSTKELNLTTELAGAKAISVKRAAATVATDTQYISSVVTQVEDNGDETYDLRFVALVSVNKSEEGVYTRPGTYGFHVEFTGTSVVNQDVEVKNYYNSISSTVDGVTTWYANEDSGKYDGTSLDSIPMIGEEVIGDEYYSSKLVIALTVTNVTDPEAAFKVKPYVSIEGQEIAYGAEKETTVGEHVEEEIDNTITIYLNTALDWGDTKVITEAWVNGNAMTPSSSGKGLYEYTFVTTEKITTLKLDFKQSSSWFHVEKKGNKSWNTNSSISVNLEVGKDYQVTNVNFSYGWDNGENKWYTCDVKEI